MVDKSKLVGDQKADQKAEQKSPPSKSTKADKPVAKPIRTQTLDSGPKPVEPAPVKPAPAAQTEREERAALHSANVKSPGIQKVTSANNGQDYQVQVDLKNKQIKTVVRASNFEQIVKGLDFDQVKRIVITKI